jgi:hypothetical protein
VELASTLALAVALVQVAMGVLRLGGLVSLISTPVVAGACAAPRRAAPRRAAADRASHMPRALTRNVIATPLGPAPAAPAAQASPRAPRC